LKPVFEIKGRTALAADSELRLKTEGEWKGILRGLRLLKRTTRFVDREGEGGHRWLHLDGKERKKGQESQICGQGPVIKNSPCATN